MPPREEDQENLAQDVGGRDVEVVFQSWDGYVSIYLRLMLANAHRSVDGINYTLFHILLTGHHGFLANLEAHLGRLIVHEAAESRRELTSTARLLGVSTHLAVGTPIIRTSLRLGRGRRAHHRDGRHMLWYRVVKRWRVCRGGSVGTSLHLGTGDQRVTDGAECMY